VSTFRSLGSLKFYFVAFLIALCILGVTFRDTIDLTVKGKLFSATDFRECRDPYKLQIDMDTIAKSNPNIDKYVVFLYEPKNQSFYKKLILTNSEIARNSPSLQMRYLKDQPSINAALDANGYYLVDQIDMQTKTDLKVLKDLGVVSVLYYRLSADGVPCGEIGIQFFQRPTPQELEKLLKQLSPILYKDVI